MAEATIRDVARRADVSVASVSRALNGLAHVHPDTRARVMAAASELCYVPHAGARSLSMARTQTIGVVLPDLHGEFFSEIVRGLDAETSARGYQLLLSNLHAGAERAGQAMRAMRGRVDGLVVMAPHFRGEELAQLLPPNLPTVLINTPEGSGRSTFRVDNRAGVDAMVAHLVASGRRHILHIAGPPGNIDAEERRVAFVDALARHAIGTPQIVDGDFTEESGQAAIESLPDLAAIDAVFAANDMMALGALQALRAVGVAVPAQVAVAGFDDVPLARFLSLTTMRVRMDEIGRRAAGQLVDQLEGREAVGEPQLVVPDLAARATTQSGDKT